MSKGIKIALYVIGGFVAFVALIIGVAFYATSGPVKAVDANLLLLRQGKIEEAYKATAKDFQNAVDFETYQKFLSDYPSFKNNKSASYSSRAVENDTATLQGTLTANDGGATPVEFKLVKENGEWRILSMEVKDTGIKVTE